jgi:antitoxin component YwqK of YwqJK toxin-antitoxin module
MKRILFVCLLAIFTFSASFAQTAANATDSKGKKQGFWEEKLATGVTRGNYSDDLKDGCWSSYSADGKLLRIDNFKKGKRDGIAIELDTRGYLAGESYYSDDLLEGTAKRYFYGTNPASLIDYVHGKMNGKKKIYYENSVGKPMEESDYKNDMKDGISKYFYISGDVLTEYTYVNNQIQGVVKNYYPGNKIQTEQEYVNNIENGFVKEYYENGKLKTEGIYVKGSLNGVWKEYADDGHLTLQGNYVNGEKEGKWNEYNADGKVSKTTVFVKGQVK